MSFVFLLGFFYEVCLEHIIYMTVQACGYGYVVSIRSIILLTFVLFGPHDVLVKILLLISMES